MKNKNILVTGAGGFIGSNLMEELLKKGYKVRALLKKGESTKNILNFIKNPNLEIVRGDLRDKRLTKKICKNIGIIYHLAAKTDLSTDNYRSYYLNNVIATKNLVESSEKNIIRFIYFSSILAVGLPNTSKLLDEKYIGTTSSFYGKSKKEAEEYLVSEYRRRKFPVVIFRPSTVYGPKEVAVQYLLFKVIKEHKFLMIGNGKNLNSYVYVKNVVGACLKVLNYKKVLGEIYFICDERPYKLDEIIKTICKISKTKLLPINVPYFIAYSGSFFYSKLCKLIGLKALIYPSRVNTIVLNYAYSIKKAKIDFNYDPKYSLSAGVSETYEWYKNNNYL